MKRVIAVVAMLLWLAPSASATPTLHSAGAFDYLTSFSSLTSGDVPLTVFCPPNTRVTGVGASVADRKNRGENRISTLDIQPDDHGTVTFVLSRPPLVHPTITVICMTEPLANFLFYESSSIATSTSSTGNVTGCTAAGTVVGGGVTLDDNDHLILEASHPQPAVNFWAGRVEDTDATAHNMTVDAACFEPTPPHKIRIVQNSTRVRPNHTASVVAMCPSRFHVASGGTGNGPKVLMSRPVDGSDRDRAPDDGWAVRGFNGQTKTQRLVASAVCFR